MIEVYKEWVKSQTQLYYYNYYYYVAIWWKVANNYMFYPLFIHCINTQRGCHTLKYMIEVKQIDSK